MGQTIISWTAKTLNPLAGCSIVSAGCKNCYAMKLAHRLESMGQSKYAGTTQMVNGHAVWTGQINLDRKALQQVYKWQPCRIFLNSMSDLFHEEVPSDFRAEVFDVMVDTPQHTYQVLTKRPHIAAKWPGPWPSNIWMGASVEDERVLNRVDELRECQAEVRFLSIEPLIGPLPRLNLEGIHWVIVGGESGKGFRPMDHAWARDIRDKCLEAGVAFFFKQSAAFRTEQGTSLEHEDGSFWNWMQYPGDLQPPTPAPVHRYASCSRAA